MPVLKEKADALASLFPAFEASLNGAKGDWVHDLRTQALARFNEQGIPTTRNEEWRYTNVASLAQKPMKLAPQADIKAADLAPYLVPELDVALLVFVNGRYAASLSHTDGLPEAATVCSLKDAIVAGHPALKGSLGELARQDDAPFVALNTAFLLDGLFIHVPKGLVVEKAVHALFVSTGAADEIAQPRNLLVFEENSHATLLEHYVGLSDAAYLTNAVTEVSVGAGAQIDHTKLNQEGPAAWHIETIQATQGGESNWANHSITLGGQLTRNDIGTKLNDSGIECTVNGFYLADGTQHVDNHTVVDHAMPECHSYEIYKGVLDDTAKGVFNGKIFVRQDAQKTDAKQDNKGLLLSRDAELLTKPQLEIFADDVKCTHGATVGELDEQAIFYLRSRGIDKASAMRIMTLAFADDVLGEIKNEAIREWVKLLVRTRLESTTALRRALQK